MKVTGSVAAIYSLLPTPEHTDVNWGGVWLRSENRKVFSYYESGCTSKKQASKFPGIKGQSLQVEISKPCHLACYYILDKLFL